MVDLVLGRWYWLLGWVVVSSQLGPGRVVEVIAVLAAVPPFVEAAAVATGASVLPFGGFGW
jgi:hypothetical protein